MYSRWKEFKTPPPDRTKNRGAYPLLPGPAFLILPLWEGLSLNQTEEFHLVEGGEFDVGVGLVKVVGPIALAQGCPGLKDGGASPGNFDGVIAEVADGERVQGPAVMERAAIRRDVARDKAVVFRFQEQGHGVSGEDRQIVIGVAGVP